MAHRTPCNWMSYPRRSATEGICSVCLGHIKVDGIEYCPFMGKYTINPEFQHLLTAEERYYSISQLRKLEELREG